MVVDIKIEVPKSTFIKDPQQSKLGLQLIAAGIELINEIGLEAFTFKKLATRIQSTESSVYRYFENKHQFLQFLFAWYWGWMEYKIHVETASLTSSSDRLYRAIALLTEPVGSIDTVKLHNEDLLKSIIHHEGIKAVLTRNIDEINKTGTFENYKQVVEKLSAWIIEIAPNYRFPQMLLSTIIEGAHLQYFFSEHLPRLTNNTPHANSIELFFQQLIQSELQLSTNE
jgi:AcrR family transcriptional regulator